MDVDDVGYSHSRHRLDHDFRMGLHGGQPVAQKLLSSDSCLDIGFRAADCWIDCNGSRGFELASYSEADSAD